LGPTAQTLANLEGLDAHAAAVTIRLAALETAGAGAGAGGDSDGTDAGIRGVTQ
jgi:N-methylhydantoinase B/oxoprolinase/acetone carboxylase alpha subunit